MEVSLSGSYKERVCGLCGNFNQFPQDDMTTKTGRIVGSAATFGNSWRVRANGALRLVTCPSSLGLFLLERLH